MNMDWSSADFKRDYGVYVEAICEPLCVLGYAFNLYHTGGGCMALEYTRENGDYLLITDAYDTLSPMPIRERRYHNDREILGYAVGYYDEGGDQVCTVIFPKARDAQAVAIAVTACIHLADKVSGDEIARKGRLELVL